MIPPQYPNTANREHLYCIQAILCQPMCSAAQIIYFAESWEDSLCLHRVSARTSSLISVLEVSPT